MTLIELLIYIALLTMILTGAVFSAESILLSQQHAQATISAFSQKL